MGYKAPIKEIFTSIQGEGPLVGYKQLFIRFSGCNLACKYCDTDQSKTLASIMTSEELVTKIYNQDKRNIHSISMTGGEPLLHYKFLKELAPELENKIYLETNGTLADELSYVGEYIDFIAMDIKLSSAAHAGNLFDRHREFLKCAKCFDAVVFAKVVFNSNITTEEIISTAVLAKEFNLPLILQPESGNTHETMPEAQILEIYDRFLNLNENTRVIPQVHKFLGVR